MATSAPMTLVRHLQEMQRRLRRLEHAQDVSVGPYVIELQGDQLVARHAVTGVVTVLASP